MGSSFSEPCREGVVGGSYSQADGESASMRHTTFFHIVDFILQDGLMGLIEMPQMHNGPWQDIHIKSGLLEEDWHTIICLRM